MPLARNLISTLITQSQYTADFCRNTATHKNTSVCDNFYTFYSYAWCVRMQYNSYTLRAGHISWRLVWLLNLLVISISTAQWKPIMITANFNALIRVRYIIYLSFTTLGATRRGRKYPSTLNPTPAILKYPVHCACHVSRVDISAGRNLS